ncbi:roadblock/LC7 domain-containing protein [Streptomyces sp. HNM0574]|uniref:roadblock/LC7 domain-containing protein n=1 Tax=Streptomyces sp. HNM0574 TaxID=2714954 RepID=UPI00146A7EB2|nr:roadblock/LC7 domain-containing protein [Streptomyces sp. HNM0574]NLU67163.1 roadblock/LC7 domain-containing protein [Streptomyces sp. HNM0574]
MSHEARSLRFLLANLVDEVPGIRSVAVVSSDGLLLLSSDPDHEARATTARAVVAGEDEGPGARETASGLEERDTADSGPRGSSADLATIVSGVGSLTLGAAKLMDGGDVRQTMISMDEGSLFVTSISDGSLLGVHATADCDMSVIAYHMALFVGRAGHVLTPELRTELRTSMELDQ